MIVDIKKSVPCGSIFAPPSKSYAHRALICAAFSEKSIITNIELSDDVKATISSLEQLGIKIKLNDNTATVYGIDRNNIPSCPILNANESGSTLRFLIPVCLTLSEKIKFCGTKKLFSRPLKEYEELSKKHNFLFQKSEDFLTVYGKLCAGDYQIYGDVSSQFVSGMVLALAFLDGNSSLKILGDISSKPYIDITLDVLKSFGIETKFSKNTIIIKGQNRADNTEYVVEGDCSNSAYIEALKFLGGNIIVNGLNDKSIQGDYVYKQMFRELENGKKEFDLSHCPDLAPIMFAVSCFFGGSVFNGTNRLKYKESDRAVAMQEELKKFGVNVSVYDNSVIIDAKNIHSPTSPIDSHNDHRIVMALALLCIKFGGKILGAEAVNKSYPTFFTAIQKLGVEIEYDA